MKHIDEFSIKEYLELENLLKFEGQPDLYAIFELFDEDFEKLNQEEYRKKWNEINNMQLTKNKGIKLKYNINGKVFKPVLNPMKIKASQYIDFQYYIQNNGKINELISVFLIPVKKKWYGKEVKMEYNEGYDVIEVQEYLLNNMKIVDAKEISDFFLLLSIRLMKNMETSLTRKKMKMVKKAMEKIVK